MKIRHEQHFGQRVVRCFADRWPHLPAMLTEAARGGDSEALVDGDRRWSWRQLHEDSGRVAAGLARLGVRAGDRVVLLAPNCAEFVLATFGAIRLGAVVVPVSMREAGPGIAFIAQQCGAALVIADPAVADLVPGHLQRVLLPGGSPRDGWTPFDALLREGAAWTDAAPGEEDPAALLYTSGTTGAPKGAVLTHLNLIHSVLHYRQQLGLGAADRGLLAVPASHVTGLVALVLAMAGCGGALVLLREFKAAPSLALCARERVTYTLMVPAMYALWLREPSLGQAALSALRVAGFGGAPMAPATIEGLQRNCPGIRLFNAYGSTETSSPATMTPQGGTRLDAVGQPLPCADIRVMDDDGREVPRGTPGEVWIAGPMVVPRYWENPDATASGFVAGYWKSGDIGTLDEDGYLRVHDRKKDMINRGGYKVFSVEVENCLLGHEAVVEAATVGVPCPVLGERIHAFVYAPTAGDREALQRELAARCKAELADYKTPDFWTCLDAPLPRNANGKVMKRTLRALGQDTPTS
jgi:O-succinylbenzoic acid--CoA ligase